MSKSHIPFRKNGVVEAPQLSEARIDNALGELVKRGKAGPMANRDGEAFLPLSKS